MRYFFFIFFTKTNYYLMEKTNFTHIARCYKFVLPLFLAFFLGNVATAQCTLVCNDNVQISIPDYPVCSVALTPDMVLEGDQPNSCPNGNLVVEMKINNVWVPAVVNYSHIDDGAIQVRVRDLVSGNSCWGWMTVEDKLPPVVVCADITLGCEDGCNIAIPAPVVTDCDPTPTITFTDVNTDLDCAAGPYSYRRVRTYTVTDDSGNSTVCTRTINFVRRTLGEVVFPDDITIETTASDCSPWCEDNLAGERDAPAPSSTANALTGKPGSPLIDGRPIYSNANNPIKDGAGCTTPCISDLCTINMTYTDQFIPICGGTYKILRTWVAVDWCAPAGQNILSDVQVIKVADHTAPTLTCPANVTIGTQSSSCTGSTLLGGSATDLCSGPATIVKTTTAGVINAAGTMITGIPCGQAIVTYVASDVCGNSTSCQFTITVQDDDIPTPICDEITQVAVNSECIARVYASTFDDGSHDNCGDVWFDVRRMTAQTNCFNANFGGFGIPASNVTTSHYDALVGENFVEFCCQDVCDTQIVVLRVYDDANKNDLRNIDDGDGVWEPGEDRWNDCMVQVYVEDKQAPLCLAPADQTIDCDAGYNLWDLEQFGQPVFADNCDADGIPANNGTTYTGVQCQLDTNYVRTWNLDQCQEGVIVRHWDVRDKPGNEDNCEQRIYVEHVSDFQVCFPADVTFDDCDEDEAGEPIISDDDCELAAVAHDDLVFNIVDTFCYKIQRTWTVVNWCIYDPDANNTPLGIPSGFLCWRDNGDGYFRYTQIIKVLDDVPPVISSTCDDVTFCDYSAEDDVPGNTDYSESCDGYAELILAAHDACSPDANLEYSWRIYAPNNTVTPLYSGTGSNASGEYPYGTYLIKWEVEDGCGNISYCEYNFTINDCKKPSVVCYFGLAAELMGVDTDGNGTADQGQIVIWDTEFLTSWDDNCTPNSQLKLRVQRQSNGAFATVSNPANLGKSVTFTCADYDFYAPQGHAAPVRLWVGDNAGNWDYCETFVTLQNNMGACGPQSASAMASGTLATEEQESVDNATVTATNINTNATFNVTNNAGSFSVMLPTNQDYAIEAERNDDPLNGVTTWDLVLITKHILGVSPLGSPYKMIAADVNGSASITAYDLVELRKLILHITNEFPNGTPSWSFIPQSFVFPTPSNPWATDFPTQASIDNMAAAQTVDFVGVKYGDVNASAAANILLGGDDRNTNGTLTFKVADQKVAAGEEFTVEFKAADFSAMGYQFTLNFNEGVEFTGVKAGALNVSEENFGIFNNAITTSWNGQADLKGDAVLFSLTFKAKQAAQLSNVLSIGSSLTPAEAYSKDADLMDVNIQFSNGTVVSGAAFDLYQNEPNPFTSVTTIGFNLPEAGNAKLTIFDAAGKVLKVVDRNFAKGYNAISLNRNELSASGVIYYELSTATESATKKMIIIE
jgi:hypothetical protein